MGACALARALQKQSGAGRPFHGSPKGKVSASMTARRRTIARRRGQGTTEYIVLVGLIAILLVAAVLKFSDQIKITFIGTTKGVEHASGQGYTGSVSGQASAGGTKKTGKDADGYPVESDDDGATWHY